MNSVSPNKKLYFSAMLVGWLFVGLSIYVSSQSFFAYIDGQFSWFSKEGALNILRILVIAVLAFAGGLAIELAQKYGAVAIGYNDSRPRDKKVAIWMFSLALIANISSMTWGIHNQVVKAELAKMDVSSFIEKKKIVEEDLKEIEGELAFADGQRKKLSDAKMDEADIVVMIKESRERAYKKALDDLMAWKSKKIKGVRPAHRDEDLAWIEHQYKERLAKLKAQKAAGGEVSAEMIAQFRKERAEALAKIDAKIEALKEERAMKRDAKFALSKKIAQGVSLPWETEMSIWKKSFYIALFVALFTTALNYWLGRLQLTIEREDRRAARGTSVFRELDEYSKNGIFTRKTPVGEREESESVGEAVAEFAREASAPAVKTAEAIWRNIQELSEAVGMREDGKLLKVPFAETGLHSRDHAKAMEFARAAGLIEEVGNKVYIKQEAA